MAILYDWYENPGTNEEAPEERGLHPRPLLNGKVTMRQLYNRVHARKLAHGGRRDERDRLPGANLRRRTARRPRGAHRRLGYFAPTLEPHRK